MPGNIYPLLSHDLHNEVAQRVGEAPVETPWKQSKAKLVDKIEALKAKLPKERETRRSVIGETIIAMAADPALTYDEIAEAIRIGQGAKTSAKSVASVVFHARKNGLDIPKRQKPTKTNETD